MKEKFIKSTIILLIGGFLTKLLGMINKIIITRTIGTENLGIYMLILPTFSLFIGLSQFGFPIALSKLISQGNKNNKRLFSSVIPLSILINIVLIIVIVIIAPYLSNNLLRNKNTYYAILAISLVIPFTTISSICRSYFFGKEKMLPHVISNLIEDIVRLLIIIIFSNKIITYPAKYIVCFLVLINIVSELASTLVLIIFIPKKITIHKKDLLFSKSYAKECLRIGFYSTSSRLIGSIGYFLEPIILTNVLKNIGYSSIFITNEYGILSGYVMPVILLPSFFTMAISQALLPIVSKEYTKNNYTNVKKKIKLAIIISLLIGIPSTIILTVAPDIFLNVLYKTTLGANYMKVLAPICVLQYIQAPLSFSLDAMGKSNINMVATTLGTITRTIGIFIFSYLKIGIWSLIISISLNIIIVTFYEIKSVKKLLN